MQGIPGVRGQGATVQKQDRSLPLGAPIEIAKAQAIGGDAVLLRQYHLVKAEAGAHCGSLQVIMIFVGG
jgi:hypothetical protein